MSDSDNITFSLIGINPRNWITVNNLGTQFQALLSLNNLDYVRLYLLDLDVDFCVTDPHVSFVFTCECACIEHITPHCCDDFSWVVPFNNLFHSHCVIMVITDSRFGTPNVILTIWYGFLCQAIWRKNSNNADNLGQYYFLLSIKARVQLNS